MDNKSSRWLGILTILIASVLTLSACSLADTGWNIFSERGDVSEVEIDPAHQGCELASDCVLVYTDCSGCDCGVPVNVMYEDLYTSLYIEACSEYSGPVCEMYCPPSALVCQTGLCGIDPSE